MAINRIRAVCFDMGGTLEDLYHDDAIRAKAAAELHALLCDRGLAPALSVPELQAAVLSGMRAYHDWRLASEMELPPETVWVEYIFPHHGFPRERLRPVAEELSVFYESHFHTRRLRPEARAVLGELRGRGLRLAVISNVLSRGLVPAKLEEYGIASFLDPVVTSSEFGKRKPNAAIFEHAASLMGLLPAACAHVGDTVSRDIVGARRAGFGLAVQIKSFLTSSADRHVQDGPVPDAVIDNLGQVVDLVA